MSGMGTMGLYGDTAGMSGSGSGDFGEPKQRVRKAPAKGRRPTPAAAAIPMFLPPARTRPAGPLPRPAKRAFPCVIAAPCGSIFNG